MSYEVPNNVLNAVPAPVVSVRTSTYNHEKYIRQCIEGVLMQKTDFAFEYIIGEDCSTDSTREIVLEYAQKYPDIIRVVTADRNVGMKANGLRCIERCRGSYIAVCEGDDYWSDPYKLQKQVDFLRAHPECSICATECEMYLEESGEIKPIRSLGKPLYTSREFLKGNQVYTLTTLIKAEYVREYQMEIAPLLPPFRMGDYSMWLYLLAKGPAAKMPDFTSVYRVLNSSSSHFEDAFEQVKFSVSAYDIRIYFNDLMGYGKKGMVYRRWRDTRKTCLRMRREKGVSFWPLYFKSISYLLKNKPPYPTEEIRNKVRMLNPNIQQ